MPKVKQKSGCVIGIDPSLTGLAFSNQYILNGKHSAETMRLSSSHIGTSVRDRLTRYSTLIEAVLEHLAPPCSLPSVIVIEGYSMGSRGSALTGICEFGGLLRYNLSRSYPKAIIYEVAPQTLKKFITGKGGGKGKTEVIACIASKYGEQLKTDDEYDAYGLGRIALCLAGFVEPVTTAQKEVVAKLLHPLNKKRKGKK
jgi:Holliday junction resolvasome RuvABC endonuclease subunit